MLTNSPILRLANFKVNFTDASEVGLLAVLLQVYGVDWKLPEKNYTVIEKTYNVFSNSVWTYKSSMYIFGIEFVLVTYHTRLSFLQAAKVSNSG